ncbi:FAD:protein FMN transferase [Herbaspirillum lusitanum]|uniref:FAD:protein FMN transferase n=1 Tax=Herbaspirillum lusitanum TaxID=213312 RepID=A0ABW9A1K2_9BURK
MNRVLIPADLSQPPMLPAGVQAEMLSGATMGTSWRVNVMRAPHLTRAQLQAAIEAQLELVIAQMSTWAEDSLLTRYNRAQAGSWHALPPAFFDVLDCALSMAFDSDGAYDPSVGPLVNLWGFGPDGDRSAAFGQVPDAAELELQGARCGWQRIAFDRAQRRVQQPGGAYLDFSGIAKGYAVDLVASCLHDLGCPGYLVEIGGELRGFGTKADRQPWWVALERPPGDQHESAIVAALHGLSIASSGDYRRHFDINGGRYAHTIDPRSGRPVQNDVASVTVLHPQCMVADALATVLTVLGEPAGMAFARERNIAALFICNPEDSKGRFIESMTPAFAAMLD